MLELRHHATGLLVLAITGQAFAQEQAENIKDAFLKGTPSLDFNYRIESVSDDAFEKDALASTLRTALSFRTLPFKGFSGFLEFQNVATLSLSERYDNGGAGDFANGVTGRPVILDPARTSFQQVYFRVDALDTAFDLGRREIVYGDSRFIGDVHWRQNRQAFKAIYLMNRSFHNAAISYTFTDKVYKVSGAELDMSSHFLNGVLTLRPKISLELFGYLLDYTDTATFGLSSQSYGFRLLGDPDVSEDIRVHLEVEYANQRDFADNPADFDANYLELMGGVGFRNWVNVKVARERLGAADGPYAFQTPLATLHKFNGWADRFLVTPENGLVDAYLGLDGKFKDLSWGMKFHNFTADVGGESYGTELDVQAAYPMPWKQVFAAKVALYREDGFSADVTKFWFWTSYTF